MSFEARLSYLESLAEIRRLVARYGLVMDEHDLEGIREIFAPDARIHSRDGVLDASGIEQIVDVFGQRFDILGPTFHVAHEGDITIDPDHPDEATGTIPAHAEVVRGGEPVLLALHYNDRYRRTAGRWQFAERELAFFYFLTPGDYVEALATPTRIRAYGTPVVADLPRVFATRTP